MLMFNQNVFEISSVGRSTYTYKSVNCVNVYGRDVTLDFQTNLVKYTYARISVCAFWWQAGTMCVYYELLCFDIQGVPKKLELA